MSSNQQQTQPPKRSKDELIQKYAELQVAELEAVKRRLYQLDPLKWLKERFGEEPKSFLWALYGPEYKDHVWDGDKNPLANAWLQLAKGKWVGIEAATGTAKTYFLSRAVFWFLDVYVNSLVVTSAPKQDQLKLHLWAEITRAFHKFKKIRPHAELFKLRLVVDSRQGEDGEEDQSNSWQAVGFVAGTEADNDSATKAQGFHRKDMMIIMEECAGMAVQVMNAFQNTSTGGNNIILGVGNPDSELDVLHQFCTQADVKGYRISAFDFPNIVLKKEVIPGAVTLESIERRRLKYGENSGLFQSRVRGKSPAQSTDSLIMRSWVEDALTFQREYDGTYHAAGVDVANSETGDKAAVALGRGNILSYVKEFKCPNATHLAYNLIWSDHDLFVKKFENYDLPMLADYDIMAECVGVDAVGVGVATVNAFVDNGIEAIALQGGCLDEVIPMDREQKPMWSFGSLRSQMYWELREDLRNGFLQFDIDNPALAQRIMVELTTPRFKVSSTKIEVERKEDIKKRLGGKSPNVADAIVYWNWMRKGHYVKGGMAAISGGSSS